MGRVKVKMEKILFGELLVVEGINLWDEFFDSFAGQKFIRQLNVDAPFFAQYDTRSRTICVFGSNSDRAAARELITNQIHQIHEQRHVLPLRRELVGYLLAGELVSLQSELGEEKLSLNVVARTLTVRGDMDDVDRVRRAINDLQVSSLASLPRAAPETPCPICFCEVTDPIKLDCGHTYCVPCLRHCLCSLAAGASSFTLVSCIADVHDMNPSQVTLCGIPITYGLIRQLLNSTEETNLLEASFLSHIQTHPKDFHYCPSPDCKVIYRTGTTGTVLQCPSCMIRICASCHTEYHEGLTCAEHQDNLSGNHQALARWKALNGVKECPNCRTDIEKNGGCNHITCFKCKTHICWVCMKTFSNSGSDGGIYPHMQAAHGGIGVVIPDDF